MLEAIEGRRYPELLRERILDPLGMTASEPAITNDMRERLAVGYEYGCDDRLGYSGAPLAPATWLETDTADGSIASTAEDMCAFARMLCATATGRTADSSARPRSPGCASPTSTPAKCPATATGSRIGDLGGHRLIGHGGGMVGYRSALQADTEAGVAAVVLQNGPAAAPVTLARRAIGIALGRPPSVTPDAREVPTGRYQPADGSGDAIELVAGRKGVLLRTAAGDIALDEWDDGLYAVADPAWDRFPLEIDGTVTAPELWHGDRRYVPTDTGHPAGVSPPPALRAIAGHYRAHNPWAPHFRVVLRGARPWLLFPAPSDGFDASQPLTATNDGEFRCGEDPANPERLSFDTVVDGHALRASALGLAVLPRRMTARHESGEPSCARRPVVLPRAAR